MGNTFLNTIQGRKSKAAMCGALALLTLLLLTLLWPATARAASLGVSISAEPDTLVEAGEVDLQFNLANNGSVMLEDITVSGPSIDDFPIGNLDVGKTRNVNRRNFKITKDRLGKKLDFKFTWIEGGSSQSTTVSLTIGERQTEPKIEFQREMNKATGAPGDEITITYIVQNTGDVDLKDVTIKDFGATIGEAFSLAVGSGTKRIEHKVTLGETSVISEPTLTASGGDQKLEKKLDAQPITVTNMGLSVSVTAKAATAEGVPVDITVTNTGNVAFNDITIADDKGVTISSGSIQLGPGGTNTIPYTVTDAPRDFLAVATGMPEMEGAVQQSYSSIPITLEGFVSPEDIELLLEVDPARVEQATPTDIELTFRITNTGPTEMTGAVLQAVGVGPISGLSSTLAPGTTEIKMSMTPSQTQQLQFEITANGAPGQSYKGTATLDIVVGGLPAATPTDELEDDAPPSRILLYVVLGLGILLIAAIVVLAVMLVKDARKKEQVQEDEELDVLMDRSASRKERKRLEQEIDKTFGPEEEEPPRKRMRREKKAFLSGEREGEREAAVAGTTFSDDEKPRRRRKRQDDAQEQLPRRTVSASSYSSPEEAQKRPRTAPPSRFDGASPGAVPQERMPQGTPSPGAVPPQERMPQERQQQSAPPRKQDTQPTQRFDAGGSSARGHSTPGQSVPGQSAQRQAPPAQPPRPQQQPPQGVSPQGQPPYPAQEPYEQMPYHAPQQGYPATPGNPFDSSVRPQRAPGMSDPQPAQVQQAPAQPAPAQPAPAQPVAPAQPPQQAPPVQTAPVQSAPVQPAAPAPQAPAPQATEKHSTSSDWEMFADEFSEF